MATIFVKWPHTILKFCETFWSQQNIVNMNNDKNHSTSTSLAKRTTSYNSLYHHTLLIECSCNRLFSNPWSLRWSSLQVKNMVKVTPYVVAGLFRKHLKLNLLTKRSTVSILQAFVQWKCLDIHRWRFSSHKQHCYCYWSKTLGCFRKPICYNSGELNQYCESHSRLLVLLL